MIWSLIRYQSVEQIHFILIKLFPFLQYETSAIRQLADY